MHCPRCQTQPLHDPFVCTHCGERLLTYLDEPLGPGTGLRADELNGEPGARREPVSAGAVVREPGQRSWWERQIDPRPLDNRQPPSRPGMSDRAERPRRPNASGSAPRSTQPADVNGTIVWKLAFGV